MENLTKFNSKVVGRRRVSGRPIHGFGQNTKLQFTSWNFVLVAAAICWICVESSRWQQAEERFGWSGSLFCAINQLQRIETNQARECNTDAHTQKKKWKTFRFSFRLFLFSLQRIILYNPSICSQLGCVCSVDFRTQLNENDVDGGGGGGGSRIAPAKMSESLIVFHFAECRVNLTLVLQFFGRWEWETHDVEGGGAEWGWRITAEIRRKLVGIMCYRGTHRKLLCTTGEAANNNVEADEQIVIVVCKDVTTRNAWLRRRWKRKTNKNCDISNVSAVLVSPTRTTVHHLIGWPWFRLRLVSERTNVDEFQMKTMREKKF